MYTWCYLHIVKNFLIWRIHCMILLMYGVFVYGDRLRKITLHSIWIDELSKPVSGASSAIYVYVECNLGLERKIIHLELEVNVVQQVSPRLWIQSLSLTYNMYEHCTQTIVCLKLFSHSLRYLWNVCYTIICESLFRSIKYFYYCPINNRTMFYCRHLVWAGLDLFFLFYQVHANISTLKSTLHTKIFE